MPRQCDDRVVVIEEQLFGNPGHYNFGNLGDLRVGVRLEEVEFGANRAISRHRSKPWLPIMSLDRKKNSVPGHLPNAEFSPPQFQVGIPRIEEGGIASC